MKVEAFAKINLTLDVIGKRADGYHEVEMLMQSVSLSDTVTLSKAEKITLSCDKTGVPTDESNTAFKAAVLFFEKTGIDPGVNIRIKKNIPMQAGMAGGSADAAGVLFGLNRMFAEPLTEDKLLDIALEVGADVPFCLLGGTMLAQGIGEKLCKVAPLPKCVIAVAKPEENVSTGKAYALVDSLTEPKRPDNEAVIRALDEQDISAVADGMVNLFEEATGTQTTRKIIDTMKKNGALGAVMTGSGSAVFGIFTDAAEARAALAQMPEHETHICCPERVGCRIIE